MSRRSSLGCDGALSTRVSPLQLASVPCSRHTFVNESKRVDRRPPQPTARRQFLIGAATLAVSALANPRIRAAQDHTRIILLGTKGGPSLSNQTGRSNPSTLLLIKEIPYVIDCGYRSEERR